MHCAAGLDSAAAALLGLLPLGYVLYDGGFKERRGATQKGWTGERDEASLRGVRPWKGMGSVAWAGVRKVAPAAWACCGFCFSSSAACLETPWLIRGLSLLKGSQPFELVPKPVLSCLAPGLWAHGWQAWGVTSHWCNWDFGTLNKQLSPGRSRSSNLLNLYLLITKLILLLKWKKACLGTPWKVAFLDDVLQQMCCYTCWQAFLRCHNSKY